MSVFTKVTPYILFFAIGIAPFLPGLSIGLGELSIFVQQLPQGKQIGAILALVFNAGNIAPLLLLLASKWIKIKDRTVIYVSNCFLMAILFLTIAIWNWKPPWGLICVMWLSGVFGTMSSMSLYSWTTGSYPHYLTSALSTGMSFSGLITTSLAYIQAYSFFSIAIYYSILAGVLFISFIAFSIVKRGQMHIEPTDEYIEIKDEEVTTWTKSRPILVMFLSSTMLYVAVPGFLPFIGEIVATSNIFNIFNVLGRIMPSLRWTRVNIRQLEVILILQMISFVILICSAFFGSISFLWTTLFGMIPFAFLNGYLMTICPIIAAKQEQYLENKYLSRVCGFMLTLGGFVGSLISFLVIV